MEPFARICPTCRFEQLSADAEPCLNCNLRNSFKHWEPKAASPASPAVAVKHDADKPRYDLIPPEPLDGLARLYALGARKYDARNWEKGMAWSRIFAAMMRHAWKWFRGEEHDADDGQHHLLSVIWCAMALYTYHARKVGEDDRPACVDGSAYDVVWRRGVGTTRI